MQRALWELLVDRAGGAGDPDGPVWIRVSRLDFDLPLEVTLQRDSPELELRADLPCWRWPTDFDQPRSRLHIVCDFSDFT
jgi:hypothetical protein